MKYIKKFEKINSGRPKFGDYVILYDPRTYAEEFNEFFNVNIGRLVNYDKDDMPDYRYTIQFAVPLPDMFSSIYNSNYKNSICTFRGCIKYWSKDIDELRLMLSANKFNI